MTGPLTLGTDKITLNATDGSATFAGGDAIGASGNIGGTAIASGTVDNTIANNYSTLVNNVISSVNEIKMVQPPLVFTVGMEFQHIPRLRF